MTSSPNAPLRRALASVLIALYDGLAIQRLLAPEQALDADEVLTALAVLSRSAAEGGS